MMKKILTLILALAIVAAAAIVPAGALSVDMQNAQELIAEAVGEKAEPVAEAEGSFEDVEIIERNKDVEIAESAAQNYPQITAADATANGIRIQWRAYDGAAKYRVFYLNDNGKWAKLGDTTGLYYDHKSISINQYYTYTVRAIGSNGAYCSAYDTHGTIGRKSSPPVITKVENIAGGVQVKFNRTYKDPYYTPDIVYLYVTGGSYGSKWKLIGGSDNTVVRGSIDVQNSGTTLKYTLRSKAWGFTSVCSATQSLTYIAAPTFKVTTTAAGHQITVNKVKGAAKYRVFYKLGVSGSWQKIGDTASSLVNKNVKNGVDYIYTVRALNSAGSYISGYITDGIKVQYRSAPKLKKVEPIMDGVKFSWYKVAVSAPYYRVFRKAEGEKGWTAVAETVNTEYFDYDIEVGKTYTYTVRCFNDYNFYTSYYDTAGLSLTYCGSPEIIAVDNSEEGITLWIDDYVDSLVASYRVFVMKDGKWNALADVAEDNYTFTEAVEGETYTFTVRGLDANGAYCTSYYAPGFIVTYYKEAERVFDAEAVLNGVIEYVENNSVISGWNNPEVKELGNAYVLFLSSSYQYGENTGNINENLIRMIIDRIEDYKNMLYKEGLYIFDFCITAEQNPDDGEAGYYLWFFTDFV